MFLPGESQGRGSLVGCRLWGRTELDTTEVTQQQQYMYVLTVYVQFLSKLFSLLNLLASLSKKWKQYHLTQRVAILNEPK